MYFLNSYSGALPKPPEPKTVDGPVVAVHPDEEDHVEHVGALQPLELVVGGAQLVAQTLLFFALLQQGPWGRVF